MTGESKGETHELIPDKIAKIYPNYIANIRGLICAGYYDDFDPTETQLAWANRAALGDKDLGKAIGTLVRTSEFAFKDRYLEGQPMLADPEWVPGDPQKPYLGFGQIETFHFLRLFARDFRNSKNNELIDELPGIHPVFYAEDEET